MKLKELRIKLDQMTERIISRFKDRSRYKLNKKVYKKNALSIRGESGISFFEFAIKGLENYHASLGRYNFPDQHPVFASVYSSKTEREIPSSSINKKIEINIGEEIIDFYLNSLADFCQKGDNPSTHGETVYCDADIVELLNERINLGRHVVKSKVDQNPSVLDVENKEELKEFLRDHERENMVIKKAAEVAGRYNFPKEVAEKYFRWIIDKTLEIEIEYLEKAYKIFNDEQK